MKLTFHILSLVVAGYTKGAVPCQTGITDFTLFDADADVEIAPLGGFDFASLGPVPPNFNIVANFNECAGDKIESVQFFLDGVEILCEEHTPYAVFGDDNPTGADLALPGPFEFYGGMLPVGIHTIQAVPYPMAGCSGNPFMLAQDDFSVCFDCPGKIIGFTLIDPFHKTELGVLTGFDFTPITGRPINIRAEYEQCDTNGIDSVQFYFDGAEGLCEEYTPYSWVGDEK